MPAEYFSVFQPSQSIRSVHSGVLLLPSKSTLSFVTACTDIGGDGGVSHKVWTYTGQIQNIDSPQGIIFRASSVSIKDYEYDRVYLDVTRDETKNSPSQSAFSFQYRDRNLELVLPENADLKSSFFESPYPKTILLEAENPKASPEYIAEYIQRCTR